MHLVVCTSHLGAGSIALEYVRTQLVQMTRCQNPETCVKLSVL